MNEEVIVSNEETETNAEEITEVIEECLEEISDVESCAEQTPQNEEDEATIRELQKTISSLKEQINELEKARDSQEKMLGQLTDFATLFPAVDIECIPEELRNAPSNTPYTIILYCINRCIIRCIINLSSIYINCNITFSLHIFTLHFFILFLYITRH